MSNSEALEIDRLREKFPRSYKALVQLYPAAWDEMLRVADHALSEGKTASVVAGKLSILRGLDRSTRRWVVLCFAADRREIVLRQQKSFLTPLHDKSLDDILAELKEAESAHAGGAVPTPPHDNLPRGFVFISHHSKSAGRLALNLAEGIEALGCPCWVSPRNVRSGLEWNDEVYSATQRCGALVLLFSEEATRSKPVKGEVQIAMGRDVPIFVVKLAPCDPAKLNIGLAAYQHIDWSDRSKTDVSTLARQLHADLRQAGIADFNAA